MGNEPARGHRPYSLRNPEPELGTQTGRNVTSVCPAQTLQTAVYIFGGGGSGGFRVGRGGLQGVGREAGMGGRHLHGPPCTGFLIRVEGR